MFLLQALVLVDVADKGKIWVSQVLAHREGSN